MDAMVNCLNERRPVRCRWSAGGVGVALARRKSASPGPRVTHGEVLLLLDKKEEVTPSSRGHKRKSVHWPEPALIRRLVIGQMFRVFVVR